MRGNYIKAPLVVLKNSINVFIIKTQYTHRQTYKMLYNSKMSDQVSKVWCNTINIFFIYHKTFYIYYNYFLLQYKNVLTTDAVNWCAPYLVDIRHTCQGCTYIETFAAAPYVSRYFLPYFYLCVVICRFTNSMRSFNIVRIPDPVLDEHLCKEHFWRELKKLAMSKCLQSNRLHI